MCCLFGLLDYHNNLSGKQKTKLIRALSIEAEARGVDAAGVAYNSGGALHIVKYPGPARQRAFPIPADARVVMGHTRMTTQGNARLNRNNHPFSGRVPGLKFALAHNGVLHNDQTLRSAHHLPRTKIQTDSYIAVQLVEQQKALTPGSLGRMAELVSGSFVFTILDERDTLHFVKGDNPLSLCYIPRLDVYVYASTPEILHKAIHKTWLARYPMEPVSIAGGDILTFTGAGVERHQFFYVEPWSLDGRYFERSYRHTPFASRHAVDKWYLQELKSVASCYGYTPDDIDRLLAEGWSPEEIEDALYLQY